MLNRDIRTNFISNCQVSMGRINALNRSITASSKHDIPGEAETLSARLSDLEAQQGKVGDELSSALTKTWHETEDEVNKLLNEQTDVLLLQVKAIEDKMDALEYRTKSGWTHEKTLHLVFLVLEYVVMVVLWHLWLLLSVVRLAKQIVWGIWIGFWGLVTGIIQLVRWLLFLHP
jgi:hypothetical protein